MTYYTRHIPAASIGNLDDHMQQLTVADIRALARDHADAVIAAIVTIDAPGAIGSPEHRNAWMSASAKDAAYRSLWHLKDLIAQDQKIMSDIVWRGTRLTRDAIETMGPVEIQIAAFRLILLAVAPPEDPQRVGLAILMSAYRELRRREVAGR